MSEVEVTKSSPNCGNELLPDALMVSRYKVIADFPNSWLTIGEILNAISSHAPQQGYIAKSTAENYPAIFKKLEWWEERKVEEMPEYVKPVKAVFYIFKVKYYSFPFVYFINLDGGTSSQALYSMLPSTEQEYNAHIEGLKK